MIINKFNIEDSAENRILVSLYADSQKTTRVVPNREPTYYIVTNKQESKTKSFQEELKHYKKEINDILKEAGEPDWDKEDADPVTQETVNFALEIVEKILEKVGGFEITPDSHGRINFDWHLDNGTMFTISVGKERDLVVSGLRYRKSKLSGTQIWEGERESFLILECGLKWFTEVRDE